MSDDDAVLVERYLAGAETAAVDDRLRADPGFARELVRSAAEAAYLREALAAPVRRRRFPVLAGAAAAGLLALLAWTLRRPPIDLSGWTPARGEWTFRDGVAAGTGDARLESVESYGDFDLTCELRVSGRVPSEVQAGSYSRFASIQWAQAKDWARVRMSARGDRLEAFLDGTPLPILAGTGPAPPGTSRIAFWVAFGGRMEIRDVQIRRNP